MSAVEAPTRDRTGAAAMSLAVLRIATGLLFLWAFADKAFGLGYATAGKNAWFSGGSPTKGFLSRVDVGPFESAFHAWAGTWWCACRKLRPHRSSGMPILVEDSTETVPSEHR